MSSEGQGAGAPSPFSLRSKKTTSQGELEERKETFIDALFEEGLPLSPSGSEKEADLVPRILRGGYPETREREAARRRDAWFKSYITTILQRDVRNLANIEGLTAMPRLLSLLAARTGALLNYSEILSQLGCRTS